MIAGQAGVRAMLTHPIDEHAARFYTRFGFIASPLRLEQERVGFGRLCDRLACTPHWKPS